MLLVDGKNENKPGKLEGIPLKINEGTRLRWCNYVQTGSIDAQ